MNRRIRRMLSGLVLAGLAATAVRAEPASFRLDPVHTQVWFSVSHLGFSEPRGKFARFDGELVIDPEDFAASRAEVTVDVGSLDLGDPAWEKKILADDFLSAKAHPRARFVSERVEVKGPKHLVLHGRLTLRGVERPLALDVRVNRIGRHSFSMKYAAGFSATATLRRSDFGMRRLLPAVGDEVKLELQVEALRGKAP